MSKNVWIRLVKPPGGKVRVPLQTIAANKRVAALIEAAKEGRRVVRYYNDPEEQWIADAIDAALAALEE